MNCPKCKSFRLAAETGPDDVEIDRCTNCNGLWLDRNEIYAYADDLKPMLSRLLKKAAGWNMRTPFLCPRCGVRLYNGPLGSKSLLVDICRKCQGLWLDNRELEMVLRKVDKLVSKKAAARTDK